MQVDIRKYDLQGVSMRIEKQYLVLKVPGLAEKRPSVLFGDSVFVTLLGEKEKEYQGYVHKVGLEEVFLRFHASFHARYLNGKPCNVRLGFFTIPLIHSLASLFHELQLEGNTKLLH
jgi:helicase MOV-10